MPETARDDPALYRIFNEIAIIDQLASAAFRQVLPPPLNGAMFGVLNHFVRLGDGSTYSELARAFQVARPSMSSTLEKLARAGLVKVAPDPDDGRTKRVFITPEGRAVREAAVAATASLFKQIGPQLATIDQVALLGALVSLRTTLDEAR